MGRGIRAATAAIACSIMACLVRADEAAVLRDVRETYSFNPHELTSKQISEKSKVLDGLWARAKARAETYIPVLRSELARPEGRPFFLFDGGMLLLSLSNTATDRRIALTAMGRCDLRDVEASEYLRQVHRLATLGENTTEAAFRILADPEFKAFIPQHALTLGQNYALIYMIFPVDPVHWEPAVLARLRVESNLTAQRSLMLLAWYAQRNEGDAALSAVAADATRPAPSREYARELLARNEKARLSAATAAAGQSEASLRAERREAMRQISDEALHELDQKTALLATMRK